MNKFDKKADTWDDDPVHLDRSKAIAEAIRKQVPLSQNMEALEYGSGTGLLSFELQPHIGNITMADNSEGMLEVLNEKIDRQQESNLRAAKLDLTEDELPDQQYDLVFTQMTLHHIKDTEAILSDFYNLLKPDGYLCVADLDKEDGSFHGKDVTDVHRGFDREKLSELMNQIGFTNISFTTAFHMDKETNGTTRTFPIFLAVAQKQT